MKENYTTLVNFNKFSHAIKVIKDFCEIENIENSFSSFLSHKQNHDDFFPKSINYFMLSEKIIPNFLCFSSKTFLKFYEDLDLDFKKNIFDYSNSEIASLRMKLKLTPRLRAHIMNYLGEDFTEEI